MEKRLQNRIAESVLTINVCSLYGLFTWIIAGIFDSNLWWQLALMVATNMLMIQMNKSLILLRIRSWMVSSTFIMLAACCGFNYASMEAGIVGVCMVFALFMIFLTYQTPDDVTHTYYAYLSLGVASLFFVQTLYFVPLLWLLTIYTIQPLSWRTWTTSLLGVITPYWFALPVFLYWQDYETVVAHFQPLVCLPENVTPLMPFQFIVFIFIAALTLISVINFRRKSYEERIRTRQIYTFLVWFALAVAIFIILQPQHFNTLIRTAIICVSPFIAHFFTFTNTKYTNYLFFVVLAIVVVLSLISVNKTLLSYANQLIADGLGY